MLARTDFPVVTATIAALVVGSIILAAAFSGVPKSGSNNIFSFLLDAESSSNSRIGFAEAAVLPYDIHENFHSIEKTGDAKENSFRLLIEDDLIDPDEHCEMCYRIEYKPGATGKAGAVFKSDNPVNLDAAQRFVFFAKGDAGEENVKVSVAGKNIDDPNDSRSAKILRFAFTSENIRLSDDWQRFEVDLSNTDLSEVIHAFAFEITKSDPKAEGNTIVVYLKGMTFDIKPATQSLPAYDSSSQ